MRKNPIFNAGAYNKKITIFKRQYTKSANGMWEHDEENEVELLKCYAKVVTTSGYAFIMNDSDFERVSTRFVIPYCKKVIDAYYDGDESNRNLLIEFDKQKYEVAYLDYINNYMWEIEMQAKRVWR